MTALFRVVAGGDGTPHRGGRRGDCGFRAGVITNENQIYGGRGGTGGLKGGKGGIGAYLDGGTLINSGSIEGGSGGTGFAGTGGHGAAGVYLNGGTLITSGTIQGGNGGTGSTNGAVGDAVQFGTALGLLIIDPGAAFTGNVVANASVADTL